MTVLSTTDLNIYISNALSLLSLSLQHYPDESIVHISTQVVETVTSGSNDVLFPINIS